MTFSDHNPNARRDLVHELAEFGRGNVCYVESRPRKTRWLQNSTQRSFVRELDRDPWSRCPMDGSANGLKSILRWINNNRWYSMLLQSSYSTLHTIPAVFPSLKLRNQKISYRRLGERLKAVWSPERTSEHKRTIYSTSRSVFFGFEALEIQIVLHIAGRRWKYAPIDLEVISTAIER